MRHPIRKAAEVRRLTLRRLGLLPAKTPLCLLRRLRVHKSILPRLGRGLLLSSSHAPSLRRANIETSPPTRLRTPIAHAATFVSIRSARRLPTP